MKHNNSFFSFDHTEWATPAALRNCPKRFPRLQQGEVRHILTIYPLSCIRIQCKVNIVSMVLVVVVNNTVINLVKM